MKAPASALQLEGPSDHSGDTWLAVGHKAQAVRRHHLFPTPADTHTLDLQTCLFSCCELLVG